MGNGAALNASVLAPILDSTSYRQPIADRSIATPPVSAVRPARVAVRAEGNCLGAAWAGDRPKACLHACSNVDSRWDGSCTFAAAWTLRGRRYYLYRALRCNYPYSNIRDVINLVLD
jgi:hypothetical protein